VLLFKDVNLDLLTISTDGRTVNIRLADMVRGECIEELECSGCFYLEMQNVFADDDGFACYVSEVRCDVVEGAALEQLLARQRYSFRNQAGQPALAQGPARIWLEIEGGDIVVRIGCGSLLSRMNPERRFL
jgi:hypothetical protein